MKKAYTLILSLFMVAFLTSCDKTATEPAENSNVFYSTSFETMADADGWNGITYDMFILSDFRYTGNKVLHIGGGCVQPAASREIVLNHSGIYKLSFWARVSEESMSATIHAKNPNYDNHYHVDIKGTEWKYYQLEITFGRMSASSVLLQIFVGGIIYNDVYLDQLKLELVQPMNEY